VEREKEEGAVPQFSDRASAHEIEGKVAKNYKRKEGR